MFPDYGQDRPSDYQTLLRLARDKSTESRAQLTSIIGELFFENTDTVSAQERDMMSDILQHLIGDVERSVRKHLAIRLSDDPEAPHGLVLALANDDAEIAYPILLKSEVLHDLDLIEIVRHRSLEHQLAITMRKSVSPEVSDILAHTGSEAVIARLLENPNAQIARDTMAFLVEQSQRASGLHRPLLSRHDMPPDMAARMYRWVSAALRTHITATFDLDPSELDKAMEQAVEVALAEHTETSGILSATDRVAQHLTLSRWQNGVLTVRLLREGEVTLFERVLEQKTGLRRRLLTRLIYEPGGEGLAILCRALQMDRQTFETILSLTRKAHYGLDREAQAGCAAAIGLFDEIEPSAAEKILDRWRQHPDYLDLLRQVETVAGGGSLDA